MHPDIQYAVRNAASLASPPKVLTRLIEITADPSYSQDEVSRLLSSDPAIAAAILRLANSSVLGGVRKIASVREAIIRLGIRQVRTLVTAQCVVDSVRSAASDQVDLSYFWRRSLATAIIASRCAEHVSRTLRELAFTAGLLCDVGVMLLSRAVPGLYRSIAAAYAPGRGEHFLSLETQAIGTTHAHVGALALDAWTLPAEIVTAVHHHHTPTDPSLAPRLARLCGILSGAGEIARMLCEASHSEFAKETLSAAVTDIGLPAAVLAGVLGQVEPELTELAGILHVDVIPSRVYSTIAGTLISKLPESTGSQAA